MCTIMCYCTPKADYSRFAGGLSRTHSRGPDDERILDTGNGLMGFQRLSIMGLTPEGMQPFLLHAGGYPAHEGRFAAPRPTFQNVDGAGLIRWKQVGVQGVKTSGGVSPQEIFNMW